MSEAVQYDVDGAIALVTIASPPVNALGHAVRAGLVEALERAADDAGIEAVVLVGDGKVFSAGADITEFGKPPREPGLSQVNRCLESSSKPVIAAIHGLAYGGGLEIALSCHARVAAAEAKLGLPEVKLGLIPGGGGTQRLPRLVGPVTALEMIVSGNPIGAGAAAESGLVDAVIETDFIEGAKAYARKLVESGKAIEATRDREGKLQAARADRAAFDQRATALLKRSRGLDAPRACARAVALTFDLPFDEGLAQEREIFTDLMNGMQSKAQRHLFFAERQAARVPGIAGDVRPRAVGKVAVIGAGTMGGGIAMSFANAGIPVTVLEVNPQALERGLGVMKRNYATSVERGSITADERDRRVARLSGTTRYEDLVDADLIIEAVFEDMAVKKEVFTALDRVAKPGAILASNTSYLDVDAIASMTGRPADVLGMHFFSPAHVMKLLEVVRGGKSADDAVVTALSLGKRIGKVPVVVGVCHGFVGNRMLAARSAENEALLLEGAAPEAVDKAFTDFGFPMGPFAMGDLAGLDIGWRNRKSLGRTAVIADALCEAGRFGQKTGKGFYLYEDGARKGTPDPWVRDLIAEKAREGGIEQRDIGADEIIERTIYPMINEGARIIEEGIATRASDIDLVWVNGYGFPVGKGGPMFWADHEGLARIRARLLHWYEANGGKPAFEPSPLLTRLVAEGGGFSDVGRQG